MISTEYFILNNLILIHFYTYILNANNFFIRGSLNIISVGQRVRVKFRFMSKLNSIVCTVMYKINDIIRHLAKQNRSSHYALRPDFALWRLISFVPTTKERFRGRV